MIQFPTNLDQNIVCLTPHQVSAPSNAPEVWPVAPTMPNIMIPAIGEDGILYPVEKIEAHVKGLHHLALSVFIFSGEELLIQRRAKDKYHCGSLWANTCCTHPHYGEDMHDAVQRRLNEELGFQTPVQHRRIVDYVADVGRGLWENERVHMFRADIHKDDITPALNEDEVCDVRWIEKSELLEEIRTSPENFTPWIRLYLERYPQLDF